MGDVGLCWGFDKIESILHWCPLNFTMYDNLLPNYYFWHFAYWLRKSWQMTLKLIAFVIEQNLTSAYHMTYYERHLSIFTIYLLLVPFAFQFFFSLSHTSNSFTTCTTESPPAKPSPPSNRLTSPPLPQDSRTQHTTACWAKSSSLFFIYRACIFGLLLSPPLSLLSTHPYWNYKLLNVNL